MNLPKIPRPQMPKALKRDWCTFFPDQIWGVDISECCQQHDEDYAVGGTEWERYQSDTRLRRCVIHKLRRVVWVVVAQATARTMMIGVRAFGWMFWTRPSGDRS